jgi:hypothetical protein
VVCPPLCVLPETFPCLPPHLRQHSTPELGLICTGGEEREREREREGGGQELQHETRGARELCVEHTCFSQKGSSMLPRAHPTHAQVSRWWDPSTTLHPKPPLRPTRFGAQPPLTKARQEPRIRTFGPCFPARILGPPLLVPWLCHRHREGILAAFSYKLKFVRCLGCPEALPQRSGSPSSLRRRRRRENPLQCRWQSLVCVTLHLLSSCCFFETD